MTSLRSLLLGSSYSNSSRVIRSLKSFSSLKSLSYKNSNLTSPSIIYGKLKSNFIQLTFLLEYDNIMCFLFYRISIKKSEHGGVPILEGIFFK